MNESRARAATVQYDRLLIVRLSAMGDIIHTLPAAATLRAAFPHATLGWLIEERWAELLCTLRYLRSGRLSPERPLVDRIHTVNLTHWRHELLSFGTWQEIAAGLSELRGIHYDAVVDFQGAIRSALLARWSGSPIIFGSAQPRENAASMFYTRQVQTNGKHVVEQAMDLACAVISSSANACSVESEKSAHACAVEFPVDKDAEIRISQFTGDIGEFVILNPGAGWGAKQWPPERYGAVARELARDGIYSLVNFGPGEENLALAVESASEGEARRVSCSISELTALMRRARLMIAGDTGPLHLAAALRVPVVAIFGPTDPARNGPYATRSVVLRSSSSVTDHSRYSEPEPGLLEITIADVIAVARGLLREDCCKKRTNGP